MLVQAALVARSLVFVDQTLARHAVDGRNCSLVSSLCIGFAARGDGIDDLLDMGAQHGTHACIVLAALLRLTRALSGLCGIGQGLTPACPAVWKAAYYACFADACQRPDGWRFSRMALLRRTRGRGMRHSLAAGRPPPGAIYCQSRGLRFIMSHPVYVCRVSA